MYDGPARTKRQRGVGMVNRSPGTCRGTVVGVVTAHCIDIVIVNLRRGGQRQHPQTTDYEYVFFHESPWALGGFALSPALPTAATTWRCATPDVSNGLPKAAILGKRQTICGRLRGSGIGVLMAAGSGHILSFIQAAKLRKITKVHTVFSQNIKDMP